MKLATSLLCGVCGLVLTVPATATELSLRVRERGSGVAVADATAVLSSGDYAETDAQGRVRLEAGELPITVRILAPGYQPYSNTLHTGGHHDLFITRQAYDLDGLEVVEDRVAERISKVVLSSEELRHAPGSSGDPINVVHALPGVVTAHEGSGQMYMRGSSMDDNDTRINGIPVPYLYHFGGLRSTVNPMLVSDFNVFLGGFPVEYGDYLGGAIDVKLRAPRRDRLHQHYNLGTYDSSFLIEGPVFGSATDSFYIAGRRSYIDAVLSPERMTKLIEDDKDDREPDTILTVPRFYDAQLGWHRQLANGSVELMYMTAGDEMKMISNDRLETDPALAGKLGLEVGYHVVGINWQSQLADRWHQRTVVSYSEYQENIHFGTDPEGDSFYSDAKVRTVRAQPELHWQRTADSRYTVGAELQHHNYPIKLYTPELPAPDDYDHDYTDADLLAVNRTLSGYSAAPFAKYNRRFGDLTLGLGLRYTQMQLDGGFDDHGFSPRASLEYELTPATTLTASWGRYLQLARPIYLLDGIGNPGLRLTEAEHRVLGVHIDLNAQWSLQLEGYHKPMQRLVVSTDEGPPENYANRGSGSAYGGDLLIKRSGHDGRMGWLSYSYARTKRTNDLTGLRYDYEGDQPHTLNLVWTQPMSGNWERWRWGVRVQATSGRPYTPVIGREQETLDDGRTRYRPVYGDAFSKRLPDFYRVDLRIDRAFLFNTWRMNAYLDIHNVIGRANIIDYDYGARYERYDNPREVRGMSAMPFFGIEAIF
ncbi:hypothetical protein CAI21_15030 [Alkalilimnicola ehrlichii]|uniref:TonB-dependent receptor plug domain-containing protein n=1 Tax=Alkalilimnicola ehrlichii TaxID=351052 RepID=A0A3E0WR34_9GAMM|nr:TonB-dependent receptor [Alkalilimnicola ehrlichii]RFA27341.1 hypothetical protein CAI21_15030 [Alkalilimnicola ehrlichii]RFA34446.1 hypothetical protein CAL65_15600 [Alkalilimnicola ehrlichii]